MAERTAGSLDAEFAPAELPHPEDGKGTRLAVVELRDAIRMGQLHLAVSNGLIEHDLGEVRQCP